MNIKDSTVFYTMFHDPMIIISLLQVLQRIKVLTCSGLIEKISDYPDHSATHQHTLGHQKVIDICSLNVLCQYCIVREYIACDINYTSAW
jgi:hypothetical protein